MNVPQGPQPSRFCQWQWKLIGGLLAAWVLIQPAAAGDHWRAPIKFAGKVIGFGEDPWLGPFVVAGGPSCEVAQHVEKPPSSSALSRENRLAILLSHDGRRVPGALKIGEPRVFYLREATAGGYQLLDDYEQPIPAEDDGTWNPVLASPVGLTVEVTTPSPVAGNPLEATATLTNQRQHPQIVAVGDDCWKAVYSGKHFQASSMAIRRSQIRRRSDYVELAPGKSCTVKLSLPTGELRGRPLPADLALALTYENRSGRWIVWGEEGRDEPPSLAAWEGKLTTNPTPLSVRAPEPPAPADLATIAGDPERPASERLAAIAALGKQPDGIAVPVLQAALRDAMPSIRSAALTALRQEGSRASSVRTAAEWLLADPEASVVRTAIASRGTTPLPAEWSPALVALLREPFAGQPLAERRTLVRELCQALRLHGGQAGRLAALGSFEDAAFRRDHGGAVTELSARPGFGSNDWAWEPEDIEAELAGQAPGDRLGNADILAWQGRLAAIRGERRSIFESALRLRNPEQQRAGYLGLSRLAAPAALPALWAALPTVSAELRPLAIAAIVISGGESEYRLLAETGYASAWPASARFTPIRVAAMTGWLDGELRHPDWQRRLVAAWQLGQVNGSTTREGMRRCLEDASWEVRVVALSWLAEHPDPAARPQLEHLLHQADNTYLRSVVAALAVDGSPWTLPLLEEALGRGPAAVSGLFDGMRIRGTPEQVPLLVRAVALASRYRMADGLQELLTHYLGIPRNTSLEEFARWWPVAEPQLPSFAGADLRVLGIRRELYWRLVTLGRTVERLRQESSNMSMTYPRYLHAGDEPLLPLPYDYRVIKNLSDPAKWTLTLVPRDPAQDVGRFFLAAGDVPRFAAAGEVTAASPTFEPLLGDTAPPVGIRLPPLPERAMKAAAESKVSGGVAAFQYSPDGESEEGVPVNVAENGLKITRIDPPAGDVRGGEWIVFKGEGFLSKPRVWFGDRPALEVERGDRTTLIVTSPPGQVGRVDLIIEAPNGRPVTIPGRFQYYAKLRLELDGIEDEKTIFAKTDLRLTGRVVGGVPPYRLEVTRHDEKLTFPIEREGEPFAFDIPYSDGFAHTFVWIEDQLKNPYWLRFYHSKDSVPPKPPSVTASPHADGKGLDLLWPPSPSEDASAYRVELYAGKRSPQSKPLRTVHTIGKHYQRCSLDGLSANRIYTALVYTIDEHGLESVPATVGAATIPFLARHNEKKALEERRLIALGKAYQPIAWTTLLGTVEELMQLAQVRRETPRRALYILRRPRLELATVELQTVTDQASIGVPVGLAARAIYRVPGAGEANGTWDPGEPYGDADGDGHYTPGEAFEDRPDLLVAIPTVVQTDSSKAAVSNLSGSWLIGLVPGEVVLTAPQGSRTTVHVQGVDVAITDSGGNTLNDFDEDFYGALQPVNDESDLNMGQIFLRTGMDPRLPGAYELAVGPDIELHRNGSVFVEAGQIRRGLRASDLDGEFFLRGLQVSAPSLVELRFVDRNGTVRAADSVKISTCQMTLFAIGAWHAY